MKAERDTEGNQKLWHHDGCLLELKITSVLEWVPSARKKIDSGMRQYAWTVAIVVAKPGTCLTGLEVAIVAEKVHFTSSQSSSPKAELL